MPGIMVSHCNHCQSHCPTNHGLENVKMENDQRYNTKTLPIPWLKLVMWRWPKGVIKGCYDSKFKGAWQKRNAFQTKVWQMKKNCKKLEIPIHLISIINDNNSNLCKILSCFSDLPFTWKLQNESCIKPS